MGKLEIEGEGPRFHFEALRDFSSASEPPDTLKTFSWGTRSQDHQESQA